jgi:hypothetical protein
MLVASAPLVPQARATEFRVVPSLTLSEEYNDNLFESPTGARRDYVTRVQPSVSLSSQGAGGAWDMSYGLDYRKYARKSTDDEVNHQASLNAKLTFLDDFLKLDAGDSYSRVSLDLARNVVAESLVVNQSEQNAAFISPYLSWRLADKCTLKTGYRYSDIRYFDSIGIDKREQSAFAELSEEFTSRLTVKTGYTFSHASAEPTGYDRHDAYAGFRYDYGQGTAIFGTLGNSWQSFSNGVSVNHPVWDAGASKDFGLLAATLAASSQYTEDPLTLSTRQTSYSATLSRALSRGLVSLTGSYSEYENIQSVPPDKRHQVTVTATGRYEVRPDLTLTLNGSGDRLSQREGIDYLYHFYANAALDYIVNKHTTLGVNYSHVSYRNQIDNATGSTEVNRAIVELRLSI